MSNPYGQYIIKTMRVIAGCAKGCILKMPKNTPTRPATELVRGALFSILENMDADWSNVLDLFSGSGSLGIEALSRGAGHVDFCDQERRCCETIQENLVKTKLAEYGTVHCAPVEKVIPKLTGPYGIVLMDPPYKNHEIGKIVEQLDASGIVSDDAPVFMTHRDLFKLEDHYGSLKLHREVRHGESVIAIFFKETNK